MHGGCEGSKHYFHLFSLTSLLLWPKGTKPYLMTESVRLQPGMDEAFSPGDPRICSVVLMSTSVECLMENSMTSEGISGISP